MYLSKTNNFKKYKMRVIIIVILVFIILLKMSSNSIAKNNNSEINKSIQLRKEIKIVDHNCIDISSLSNAEIQKANKVKIYFEHASVGANINKGINNLISDNSKLDRFNLIFYYRGNPGANAKIDGFFSRLSIPGEKNYVNPQKFDLMMMKLCYIDSKAKGFESIRQMFEYYKDKMILLESQFPGTKFVWWTMPIVIKGDFRRDEFNTLVRNYCKNNNKILFDIADIESHDKNNTHLMDKNGEILNKAYTDDGGHLNDAGAIVVAKAIWWMLAKISINNFNK